MAAAQAKVLRRRQPIWSARELIHDTEIQKFAKQLAEL